MIKKEELKDRYYNFTLSVKNFKTWWVREDGTYLTVKEKIGKARKRHYEEHPETREAARERLNKRWEDPEFQQTRSLYVTKMLEERWSNIEERKNQVIQNLSDLGLEWVSGEYVGNRSDLTYSCQKCSTEFVKRYSNIARDVKSGWNPCPTCEKARRNGNYIKRIEDLGAVIKSEYISCEDPLTIECTSCHKDYTFSKAFRIIAKSRTTCSRCKHAITKKHLRKMESDLPAGNEYDRAYKKFKYAKSKSYPI
jgi:hypothetical protein